MADVRLPEAQFLAEAERLVAQAAQRGIPLRMCGSVGLYYHIRGDPLARVLYLRRSGGPDGEPRFKDLDLASLEKKSSDIYKLFVRELGFREDTETNSLFGMYRNIYYHPKFDIDVFYDTLRFSHEIPIKGRLPSGTTLTPEDLFLSKAQIHKATSRDWIDLAAFSCAFPLEKLDRTYLTELLGDDWGLWYDVDQNLRLAKEMLPQLRFNADGDLATAAMRAEERLAQYRAFLASMPKTRRWEKRQAKGTSIPWYEEVDEVR
ncbi:MAG TPA: hypothetical protein VEY12_07490 [Thermoplasmata archaeon]|nr:hypothetical protein [Thermoplasmata archaeon]